MNPDPEAVVAILREVAGAEILPRFRQLQAHEISQKSGPADLVTAADLAAEAALAARLGALTPGAVIVGEEGVAADPLVLEQLADAPEAWVIDPVDGTLNFAEEREDFAVIVAWVRDGQTVAGWIHTPVAGDTVVAEAGAGAWRYPGAGDAIGAPARLAVAPALEPGGMLGALYAGRRRTPDIVDRIKLLGTRLRHRRSARCVGIEYRSLARAELHYALFTRLLPWDHAAGVLIHREAGGYGRCLDGNPYRLAVTEGNLLLAPDEPSWRRLARLLGGRDPLENPG